MRYRILKATLIGACYLLIIIPLVVLTVILWNSNESKTDSISVISIAISVTALFVTTVLNIRYSSKTMDKFDFDVMYSANEARCTLKMLSFEFNKNLVPANDHKKTLVSNKNFNEKAPHVLSYEIVFSCKNVPLVHSVKVNRLMVIARSSTALDGDERLFISQDTSTAKYFEIIPHSESQFAVKFTIPVDKNAFSKMLNEMSKTSKDELFIKSNFSLCYKYGKTIKSLETKQFVCRFHLDRTNSKKDFMLFK